MLLAVVCFAWTFSPAPGQHVIGGRSLFLLVWERRFSWKIFMSALMVGGMVVLSAFFVEQQTYAISRLTKIFDPRYNLNQVTSGRANIAELGLQLFLRNPLGVGTGNFMSEISTVSEFSDSAVAAHSGWIKVLAENGVPGILLLGAFVASFAVVGLLRETRGLPDRYADQLDPGGSFYFHRVSGEESVVPGGSGGGDAPPGALPGDRGEGRRAAGAAAAAGGARLEGAA